MLPPILVPPPRVFHPLLFATERVPSPQASPFSGASSLYRTRHIFHWGQKKQSVLCYKCVVGSQSSPRMLFDWWLSLWELPQVQVS